MEKVSIIIPVYNVQKYLSQCLDSIVHQSYTNWECILVDDGSTDLSGQICDHYAQADSRFVVIHKQNGGAASAKNIGLDHISGHYAAFVDSDDYVEPEWLKTVVTIAQNNASDVVEFDFDKVYQHNCESVNHFPEYTEFSAESYLAQYLQTWSCSLFWNKLFRADLVKDVRFKKERRCIDDEFFTYKAIGNCKKIIRISDVLYHYRQRASSAVYSSKNQHQVANDSLDVLTERYQYICARFPNLQKAFLRHDVQILFYFASLSHTNETVGKFKKIRRFYLLESLRHPAGFDILFMGIKLQFISKTLLLAEQTLPSDSRDIGEYYS